VDIAPPGPYTCAVRFYSASLLTVLTYFCCASLAEPTLCASRSNGSSGSATSHSFATLGTATSPVHDASVRPLVFQHVRCAHHP